MKVINYGLVPIVGHSFEEMFSGKNPFFSENQGKNPFCLLKDILEKEGIRLIDATKNEPSIKVAIVLYFGNIDTKILSKHKDAVNVYIALEPPAVDFAHERKSLLLLKKYFDYILTWNDELTDGKVFLKFNYPIDFFHYENSIPFDNKQFLTNVSGKKKSNHKDELYSKRLEIINYFEKNHQEDFEFWGTGWEDKKYKNYKGTAISKIEIYKNYKYAICFENQKGLKGYITEKIWDCFICKIVPVYLGAENIDQYIPKGCYIDYRNYESVESLIAFLKNISGEEYSSYINNIENLLKSDKINAFKPESFAGAIMDISNRYKRSQLNSFKIRSLKIITNRIKVKNYIQYYGYRGLIKKLIKS